MDIVLKCPDCGAGLQFDLGDESGNYPEHGSAIYCDCGYEKRAAKNNFESALLTSMNVLRSLNIDTVDRSQVMAIVNEVARPQLVELTTKFAGKGSEEQQLGALVVNLALMIGMATLCDIHIRTAVCKHGMTVIDCALCLEVEKVGT